MAHRRITSVRPAPPPRGSPASHPARPPAPRRRSGGTPARRAAPSGGISSARLSWPAQITTLSTSSSLDSPPTVMCRPASSMRSYCTPASIVTPWRTSVARCTQPDVLPRPAPGRVVLRCNSQMPRAGATPCGFTRPPGDELLASFQVSAGGRRESYACQARARSAGRLGAGRGRCTLVRTFSIAERRCGYVVGGSAAFMDVTEVTIPALHRDFVEPWFSATPCAHQAG